MNFPIKVGNTLNDVKIYASKLINGEEQLLITRDGSEYLTDGKGGYIDISPSEGGGTGNANIDDTKKSATTTYSSEKIETITGNINDDTLDALLKGKSLQDQIKTVFTYANSKSDGKSLIGNAIGRNYLSLSYELISNDIIAQKKNIVTALKNKGVIANDYDELDSYANKINAIVQNPQMKNTKLNVTVPFTKQITMTNPTTIENICTSILEYQAGSSNIVQYECNFDNGDGINFNSVPSIVYDGTMKQENKVDLLRLTLLQDIDTGIEYETNIDLSSFYKISQLEIIENNDNTNDLKVTSLYRPVLVIAKDDINLAGVERLTKITWTATSQNNSKLLLLISTDSGVTWKGYDKINKNVEIVDTSNLDDIRNKGINITDVNALNIEDLGLLRENSPKIRFAYYFDKDNANDLLFNDAIKLTVDMKGNNIPSKNVDYKLESDDKTITYTFNKNGTYTIIYCDNN